MLRIHTLNFIDDEAKRRSTLVQLNRGEALHGLSRVVFHGKRGELRQRYRPPLDFRAKSAGRETPIFPGYFDV